MLGLYEISTKSATMLRLIGPFRISGNGSFADPRFLIYKRITGLEWDRAGRFEGEPHLTTVGGRDLVFHGGTGFKFTRFNGEVIEPRTMRTDGGSVPRLFWSLPGLDPWSFMPAFLIHDWIYMVKHCEPTVWTFEFANLVMAEAMYTMMLSGTVTMDWRVVEVVYRAVSSPLGRRVWDRPWTVEECAATLSP